MRRLLPAFLAVLLVGPGCTASGLPGMPGGQLGNNSNLTTVAPLSPQEAALKTKEGLASLNVALASLRDLKGSSSAAPKGSAATLQQAAGYRLYSVLAEAADDDELPDDSYSEIQWFHDVQGEPVITETATEFVLTQEILEEGRIGGVAVEQYLTTVTTRIPRSGGNDVTGYQDAVNDWGAQGGTYTRDEVVKISEFRKLGRYVTTGTLSVTNGKPVVQATQDFTPKGETKTYRLSYTTTFSDSQMSFTVKGDAPGGGTIDLTSSMAFVMSGGTTTATFTQKGTIVTAKGETILLDCSLDTTAAMGSFSAKGNLTLDFKDKLVLKLTMDQSASGDNSGGALYAADGTTKLGDIAMGASDPEGTVTFKDGTKQAINLQTIADLITMANTFQM